MKDLHEYFNNQNNLGYEILAKLQTVHLSVCLFFLFQVLQSSQAPKKAGGFVTKAMDYMFGW